MNHTFGEKTQRFRKIALISGPILALAFWFFLDLEPGQPQVTATAAVALLMAIWWMTEALPLAVTSLVPLVLFPVLGIMDGKATSNQYINHIIFLFLGGFMVALAMERWDLHKRIALAVMVRFGNHTRASMLGFMVACAFLSMWISNTATTMMMLPIAMAVIARLEHMLEDVDRYATGIFLGIAYSASIGGVATLVGTPPNLIFARVYSESFPDAAEISFTHWMVFALPLCIVFLFITWLWLVRCYDSHNQGKIDNSAFHQQYNDLGPMSRDEKIVAVVFVMMALLWLFRADLKLGFTTIPGWASLFPNPAWFNDGTVAVAMAVLLFMMPASTGGRILDWQTANKLPWHIMLLFGGGFALAAGFTKSGLSKWFAEAMQGAANLPAIMIVMLVCFLIIYLTELTSNTATAQVFLPVMAALAISMAVPPPMVMVPVTMACSFAFMLPVATPPNALVFGSGKVAVADMARTGMMLNLVAVVLIFIARPISVFSVLLFSQFDFRDKLMISFHNLISGINS